MKLTLKGVTQLLLTFLTVAFGIAANGQSKVSENPSASAPSIQGKEHYVMRDGLRIYLWEKYRDVDEGSFSRTGKVALLVHGGTRSGRSLYDLQIRDYSLMDFLAQNGYDVWAIDIHGYGHSDKPAKDWIDTHSAAADISAAVEYITKLRGVTRINLLGCSAGSQRAGVFAMEHPERVGKLILHAGFWKGTAEFREFNRKRVESGGQPLPKYRPTTEEDFRSDFIKGQFEEDVVEESVKVGLQMDPQRPNVFVEWVKLPILDPARITVPTMIIHGEKDFAAKEEDLFPFYSQLNTHDKQYVLLPDGGHMLMLEKDHRRFQQEVLSFFDRP
jgi:pimeloyl-ACP methyl ester carboxylesterase